MITEAPVLMIEDRASDLRKQVMGDTGIEAVTPNRVNVDQEVP